MRHKKRGEVAHHHHLIARWWLARTSQDRARQAWSVMVSQGRDHAHQSCAVIPSVASERYGRGRSLLLSEGGCVVVPFRARGGDGVFLAPALLVFPGWVVSWTCVCCVRFGLGGVSRRRLGVGAVLLTVVPRFLGVVACSLCCRGSPPVSAGPRTALGSWPVFSLVLVGFAMVSVLRAVLRLFRVAGCPPGGETCGM